ncbi:hypothetical protein PLICRDRAFT_380063 [Plicaturopsis crispa FD-325 SS-3]|nr:hypothetical protein PLICRDRAFT_380063 [Plicaturopsis crispa FD-325 SS-3]
MSSEDEMDAESFYSDPRNMMNAFPEHMRPTAYLTVQEAHAAVNAARTELFVLYDELHRIVSLHEDTIRKRWTKKNKTKREALLLDVYPGIPKAHAPDTQAFKENSGTDNTLAAYRDDFILFFANLQDLCSGAGTKFLSLLHYRAHYFPSAFATFDRDNLSIGIVASAIRRVYAQDCTVICYGGRDTYGKVISWNDSWGVDQINGQYLEWTGDGVSVADALPLLETQTKLLTLLTRAAEKILWDAPPPSSLGTALLPPVIASGQETGHDWSSIAHQHYIRPYGPPPEFSLPALAELVDLQYDLAVNHLIDLRTDPDYLASTLQDHVDHRLESAAVGIPAPQKLVQTRALRFMLMDAYSEFAMWHALREAVSTASSVLDEMGGPPSRGRSLPEKYDSALMDVEALLHELRKRTQTRTPTTICASPPLRNVFTVTFLDGERFGRNHITNPRDAENDKLLQIVFRLIHPQRLEELGVYPVTRLYDELDIILASDPTQRARISAPVYTLLTQLGSISDALYMLKLHRPNIRAQDEQERSARATRVAGNLLQTLAGSERVEPTFAHLAFPVRRFHYPPGPKTAQWAQGCEEVDGSVSRFWAAADTYMRRVAGLPLFNLVQTLLRPHIHPSTNWALQISRPRSTRRDSSSEESAFVLYAGAVSISVDDEPEPTRKGKKKKTRGQPREQSSQAVTTPAPTEPTREIMRVTARTLKAMRKLFRAVDQDAYGGTLDWTELLHALAEIGFSYTRGHGSAFRFTHEPSGRKISAHCCHPEPYLNYRQCRAFGRQLRSVYGWDGDSFVLKE